MSKQIKNPLDMANFLTAGNATFTLVSRKSGARFTYKARTPRGDKDKGRIIFVSLLNGPDNTSDYQYIGQIFPQKSVEYVHGKKARARREAPSVQLITWFTRQLAGNGAKLDQVEFWHEGTCGRCGRKLTVPESIDTGLGPECAALLGRAWGKAKDSSAALVPPAARRVRLLAATGGEGLDAALESAAMAEAVERDMQELEARGDREGTARDEAAKHAARIEMEEGVREAHKAAMDGDELAIVARFNELVEGCLWYEDVNGDRKLAARYAINSMSGKCPDGCCGDEDGERERRIKSVLEACGVAI